MAEEQLEKVVQDTIEKSLPEIVDTVTEKKVQEQMQKTQSELDEVKAELKKLNLQEKTSGETGKATKEAVMVWIIKDVMKNEVTSETWFKEIADKHIKAVMDEWTAWEWQEFVFDQFEKDILQVLNNFEVVKAVKMYNLNKWDNITFPKATNWVTTTFKWEWEDYWDPTQPNTSEIVINVAKATTMTSMTEELLEDNMTIPDLYQLIVDNIWESQAEFLENKILNWELWTNKTIEWILVNSDVNEYKLDDNETVWDIDDDDLVETVMAIPKKYKRRRSNIKWVMSQYTLWKLMQLKTTDGSFLYPELRNTEPRLWGYMVVVSDDMPVQDKTEDIAWKTSIVLWDMKYYTLVRRTGLSLERWYRDGDWQSDIQSVKSKTRVWGKCTFWEAFVKITNGDSS